MSNSYKLGRLWEVSRTESAFNASAFNTSQNNEYQNVVFKAAEPALSMQAAILDGLSLPLATIRKQVGLVCPCANCTWPTADTLEVCHQRNDLRPQLRRIENASALYQFVADWRGQFNLTEYSAFHLPNCHFLVNPIKGTQPQRVMVVLHDWPTEIPRLQCTK
jgi:hypothetical protein